MGESACEAGICGYCDDTDIDGLCNDRLLLRERTAKLEEENKRLREALERIEGGDGCSTRSYAACCDMACSRIAREALAVPPIGGAE